MYAIGDVVLLPHGRGVGLVLGTADKEVTIYLGREGYGNAPKVEQFCESEVQWTRKNHRRVALLILQELNAAKDRLRGKVDLARAVDARRQRLVGM